MTPPTAAVDKPAIVGIEALTPAVPVVGNLNGTANGTGGSGSGGPEAHRCKIAAVIPCFNRRADLEILLRDVARQDLTGIDLWCVVVDNASTEPLSTISVPPGLRVEF